MRVVVIDDGSTDSSRAVAVAAAHANEIQLDVLSHHSNMGLGATLRSGLAHVVNAAGANDIAVVMDADFTHPAYTVSALLEKIEAGADVVVASRFAQGATEIGVPLHRRFLSRNAARLFSSVLRIKGVTDFTSGFRAYRVDMLADLSHRTQGRFFKAEGFECMADLLIQLARAGACFAEVPLALRYDRKEGPSKMKVVRTTWNTLRLLRTSSV